MIDIKICGITKKKDMKLCEELHVTWVGFVFYPRSPRAISVECAKNLHKTSAPSILGGPKRVGLFVNPEPDDIAHVLKNVPLDVLQLYTSQKNAISLKEKFNIPVWLAHGIRHKNDLPLSAQKLDGFIIEAPADKNDTRPGGLGKQIDWSLTQDWHAPIPWLLAGGLTPENVGHAINKSHACAVDVSSGVENTPGDKSPTLLKEFVKNSRSWGCSFN